MPHDPALLEDTRAWLAKALMDLRAADHLRHADPPLLGQVVFHAQQAAEKALKAFLVLHDEPFRKTHNLEQLGQQALALDTTLHPLVGRVAVLTEYAWKYRYPGPVDEPSADDAEAGLELARHLYEAVVSRVPKEAHP